MYIPEYSISPKTLNNIASIEYAKAVIENNTIMPVWKKQLQKDALAETVLNLLALQDIHRELEHVKVQLDDFEDNIQKDQLVEKAHSLILEVANITHTDDESIKLAFSKTTGEQSYQNPNTLAQIVELFDWINSVDARETHPLISAGIIMAKIHDIQPFSKFTDWYANFVMAIYLKLHLYDFEEYLAYGDFDYAFGVSSLVHSEEPDLTEWLEYFTHSFSNKLAYIRTNIESLAAETTINNISGQAVLGDREQKIVLYLQDYGEIQNKDFGKLFPKVSEDTVLRTLKKLMDKGIVVKEGSTKSSRYVLA